MNGLTVAGPKGEPAVVHRCRRCPWLTAACWWDVAGSGCTDVQLGRLCDHPGGLFLICLQRVATGQPTSRHDIGCSEEAAGSLLPPNVSNPPPRSMTSLPSNG